MDERKPTIDERLEALTANLELAWRDIEAYRIRQEQLDARERKAREAILSGIVRYLEVMKGDEPNGR